MKRVAIDFTDAEYAQLERLAAHRTEQQRRQPKDRDKVWTVEDCIKAFAQTCQPGGSGWKVPGT